MPFRHITVVSIDGRPGDLPGAQNAILKSARELPGARALLLSPGRPRTLLDGIDHVPIQPLGYFEYGLFVIYALHRFISTDFALIVQDDGWVVSGQQWRDEFCRYDFIGAPIHFAKVTSPGGSVSLRGFGWVDHLRDPACRVDVVMNGGFSLRSRKLLQAPTALGLPYVVPPVTDLQGPPYRMVWESDSHQEDVHLCIDMRPELERSGLRFAPLEVARWFAVEHLHPTLHDGLDLMGVLGHHSKLRKLASLEPPTVEYQLARSQLSGIFGENLIVEWLRRRGCRVGFASEPSA
jgi:hypothetical protein